MKIPYILIGLPFFIPLLGGNGESFDIMNTQEVDDYVQDTQDRMDNLRSENESGTINGYESNEPSHNYDLDTPQQIDDYVQETQQMMDDLRNSND